MAATEREITTMQSPHSSHIPVVKSGRRQAGFTMIECLIALLVLLVGLLGLIGLQARTQQAELESYQRGQALVLLQDIVDRMNANRTDSKNQAYADAALNPVVTLTKLSDCSALVGAAYDLCDWGNQLIGAAETNASGPCSTAGGTGCAGAMLDAQGCISYDAGSELKDSDGVVIPGTGIQTVRVWWRGVGATGTSGTFTCAANNYAADQYRRMVTATLRMGGLAAK